LILAQQTTYYTYITNIMWIKYIETILNKDVNSIILDYFYDYKNIKNKAIYNIRCIGEQFIYEPITSIILDRFHRSHKEINIIKDHNLKPSNVSSWID
jgi:hypothetical protein